MELFRILLTLQSQHLSQEAMIRADAGLHMVVAAQEWYACP